MIRLFFILTILYSIPQSSQIGEIVKRINEISNKSVDLPMTRYDNSIVYISDVEFGQTNEGYYCNYLIGENKNQRKQITQKIVNFNSIKNISVSKKNSENSKVKLLQITLSKPIVKQTFNNKENFVTIFAITFLDSEEDYNLLVNSIKKLQSKK